MAYENKPGNGSIWPKTGKKVDYVGKFLTPKGEALTIFGRNKEAGKYKFIELSAIPDTDVPGQRPVAPKPEGDLPF